MELTDFDKFSINFSIRNLSILRTLIYCTFIDRRQTQRVVWRELIYRDTTVFYIT
jgi:hypothetical protein